MDIDLCSLAHVHILSDNATHSPPHAALFVLAWHVDHGTG
jgi:hypothetical protein